MDIEGVIIFDSQSGVPLFSRLKEGIDPSLFSSFIAAIGHFSKELHFGGLSSFTTEEKVIYLAARDKIITALVAPKRPEYQTAYSLARELGRQFEEQHIVSTTQQTDAYTEFNIIVENFMKQIKHPFLSRVAGFVHERYGGTVSVKSRLMKENGSQGVMDIVINLGIKTESEDVGRKKRPLAEVLSENFIFVKVSSGQIGRAELMDFIDSIDSYGARILEKDELVFVPYYPQRAVVIAREYTPEAIEFLGRLPQDKGQIILDGSHVFLSRKKTKKTRCPFDVFAWRENGTPDEIAV